MALAANASMPQVRAIASARLEQMREMFEQSSGGQEDDAAHRMLLARDITRFLERPAGEFTQPATQSAPPGAPIGEPAMNWLGWFDPACVWWLEPWER
jgi:hypothetical protein